MYVYFLVYIEDLLRDTFCQGLTDAAFHENPARICWLFKGREWLRFPWNNASRGESHRAYTYSMDGVYERRMSYIRALNIRISRIALKIWQIPPVERHGSLDTRAHSVSTLMGQCDLWALACAAEGMRDEGGGNFSVWFLGHRWRGYTSPTSARYFHAWCFAMWDIENPKFYFDVARRY